MTDLVKGDVLVCLPALSADHLAYRDLLMSGYSSPLQGPERCTEGEIVLSKFMVAY